jgi:hypothetical protein
MTADDTPKAPEPLKIPPEHLAAIGNIANCMAQLEFQIDLGIWKLVAAPQQLVACLTAQMISPVPRLKAFIGLCEVIGASAESLAALNKFAGDIGGLIDRRNRLIHDPRMVNKRTTSVVRLQITAKPKVHFGFIDETVAEIDKTFVQLAEKVREFVTLRDKVLAELSTLIKTSPRQFFEIVPGPGS